MPRFPDPTPTQTITAVGHDGIYMPGPKADVLISDRHIVGVRGVDAAGKTTYPRAGVIFDVDSNPDGTPKPMEYLNHELRDCLIEDFDWWNVRRHCLAGACLTKNVVVRGAKREHGGYDSVKGGLAVYEHVRAIDNAAQGWQIRHTFNRADVNWKNSKHIVFFECEFFENGKPEGAGRAGFSLSVKDSGPESVVEIVEPIIQTIRSRAVKVAKDGTVLADSFGAACVEYCDHLDWRGGYVRMLNADRDDIQLYDFANKAKTKTGPRMIFVDGLHLAKGCTLSVRLGDGDRIVIQNCTGLGQIKLMEYTNGAWRKKAVGGLLPIKGGFST